MAEGATPRSPWLPLASAVVVVALLVHGSLVLGLRSAFGRCPDESWPGDPIQLEGALAVLSALNLLMGFAVWVTPGLWLACAWVAVRGGSQKRSVNRSAYVYLGWVALFLALGSILGSSCIEAWLND